MTDKMDVLTELIYQEDKVQDFIFNKLVPLLEQENMSDFDIALMAQAVLKGCFNNFAQTIKIERAKSGLLTSIVSAYFIGVMSDYYKFTDEIKDENKVALLAVLEIEETEYKKRLESINKIRDEIHG